MIFEIIFPAKNEAENLPFFLEEIKRSIDGLSKHKFILTILDDFSTDGSEQEFAQWAKKCQYQTRYLRASRTLGYSRAIAKIIQYVSVKADAIILLDADMQDPPRLIPELIRKFTENGKPVVAARKRAWRNFNLANFAAHLFHLISQKIGQEYFDSGSYGLYPKELLMRLQLENRIEIYLPQRLRALKVDTDFVSYVRDNRYCGESRANWLGRINLASIAVGQMFECNRYTNLIWKKRWWIALPVVSITVIFFLLVLLTERSQTLPANYVSF